MKNIPDKMRAEYPAELIKRGEPGKYRQQYRAGNNLVLIDPDLLKEFPDSDSVNKALHAYLAEHGQLAQSA